MHISRYPSHILTVLCDANGLKSGTRGTKMSRAILYVLSSFTIVNTSLLFSGLPQSMIWSFRSCLWYSVGRAPVDVFLVSLLTRDEPYFKSVYWSRCDTYSGVFRFDLRYSRGRHLHYVLDWGRYRVWRSYIQC